MDDPTRGAPDDDRVHDVLAACIDAWQSGGPAAAERVVAAHADLAPLLRERLEKLQRAGLLPESEDVAADAPATEPTIPTVLGEFRLGKRIGGGGMGVVHLAEQMSLERVVALKLVRPELRFFPGARARFRREVEAIARLGDAGIVPIFSVGEDQGIDFFAMEYVRGASLGDVIAALHATSPQRLSGRDIAVVAAGRADVPVPDPVPEVFAGTWVQTCCRIVMRMARAVHHAHERGVVHRDLKPNNTMVTPDGRVLLLDFGLAAAAGTSRITRSGAMLGTLHYMAPEQLLDGEVDARTDVYALGVTLHELLALRPPFHDQSQERLRQQILHGRAAALRQQNPDVPRDVETIVAVARDRDPTRRYATADAMAADLERFLQHRPIEARPIGSWLRSVRWSQRHPAMATAAGLLLLGLMTAPLLVRWTRGAALQQSQSNLDTALAGVRGLMQQASSKVLARVPGLDAERIRNLDAATAMIGRLRRENPEDPRVAVEFVRTMSKVSELQRLTGDNDAALRATADAEPALVWLRGRATDPATNLAELVGVRLARGLCLIELGRIAEAEADWVEMIAAAAKVPEDQWGKQVRLALSSAHHNLARVVRERGDLDGAIEHMQRSFAIDAAVGDEDKSLDLELNRARTRMNLAAMLRDKGDPEGARKEWLRVRDGLAALAATDAKEPEVRREQARVDVSLASVDAAAGKHDLALPRREAAIATMRALVADFPARVVYRQETDLMLYDLGVERQQAGDSDGALAALSEAIAGHEQLVAGRADGLEYASELAIFMHHRGFLLTRNDEEAAGADFRNAARLIEGVVEKRPDDLSFRAQAGQVLQSAGIQAARAERWDEARDTMRRAVAHFERVCSGSGKRAAVAARALPPLLQKLAQAELMCDDFDAVMACLRRHQELRPLSKGELQVLGEGLHVDDRDDFKALVQQAAASDDKR
ncbi:MAG: serine/threonine protein kinase [Planctomycetes bacterium]|nr:serine/threonine protein kinase [Planctomycetota bacterium]